jgi:dTDP-4-dehydrorhamnose 3,5-epimerase
VRFVPLELPGAYLIELEPAADDRGFFARSWSRDELERRGLDPEIVECSVSFNARRGTLRGMHYQCAPHEETKIVRCTAGAIYDVIVDLRESSPTRRRWSSVELSAANRVALYVPKGFAHGFQTLVDEVEVSYQISARFAPDAARGVRWNDPLLGIRWPIDTPILSPRDAAFPDLAP